jgi:hypothetical protein
MVIGSAMTVKKTQVPTPTNAHFPTTIVHCHEMPMVKTSHMPRSARRRLTLACLVILVQSVLSCTPPSGFRALIPPPSSSRAAPDQSIGVVLNAELPIYFLQPDMLPTPYEERTFAAWAQQIPNIAATLLDSLVHTLPQHGYHALKLPDQIPKADWSTFGLPAPGKLDSTRKAEFGAHIQILATESDATQVLALRLQFSRLRSWTNGTFYPSWRLLAARISVADSNGIPVIRFEQRGAVTGFSKDPRESADKPGVECPTRRTT